MPKQLLKIKPKDFPDNFFKEGEIVEGEVIYRKGNKAIFIDLKKATGVVCGQEYLSVRNILQRIPLGEKIKAKVIKPDDESGYIFLSVRDLIEEKEREKIKEIQDKEEKIKVKVVGANRGGLLVRYNNLEGFLPSSQLKKEHYPKVKNGSSEEILESLKKLIGKELLVKVISSTTNKKGPLIFSEE